MSNKQPPAKPLHDVVAALRQLGYFEEEQGRATSHKRWTFLHPDASPRKCEIWVKGGNKGRELCMGPILRNLGLSLHEFEAAVRHEISIEQYVFILKNKHLDKG